MSDNFEIYSIILLLVTDPPERPEIHGYSEGETIRMGETVSLVCESFGGNPLASVVWYKNNQRIDHSYTTSGMCTKTTMASTKHGYIFLPKIKIPPEY